MRPLSEIAVLVEVCAVTMGMPSSLVVDSGRTFMGQERLQVCDMFVLRIVTCPFRALFQCGLAEWPGALFFRSFDAVKRYPITPASLSNRHLLGRSELLPPNAQSRQLRNAVGTKCVCIVHFHLPYRN